MPRTNHPPLDLLAGAFGFDPVHPADIRLPYFRFQLLA